MPAAVMDDEASRPEEKFHVDTRDSKHPSISPTIITGHPESMQQDSPHRETIESRIRVHQVPLSSYPPTTSHTGSPKHRLTSAPTTPSEALPDRPEKRMRLDSRGEHDEAESWRLGAVPSAYENEWFRQIRHGLSNTYHRPPEFMDHDLRSSCSNCHGTEDLLGSIVQSLFDLQLELSRLMPSELSQKAAENHPREVTTQGLKHSLNWSVQELRNSIRALQSGFSTTRAGLPSLADVVPRQDPGVAGHSLAPIIATPQHEKHRLIVGEPSRPDELHSRPTDHHSKDHHSKDHHAKHHHHHHHSKDHPHGFSEPGLPPIFPPDELRRGQHHEQASLGSVHSPHASSGSSAFGPPSHSPMHSQHPPYRSLPSPGSQYSTLAVSGPSHFSSNASQAAQAAHLQDLQHQISTKTLALQTLQKEHDQLLAAFSRSQIRCNTLDKKSQVSDHEINTLTEEKIRLQQQVESLETQVDELQKSRDEVHKQSSADGAQWRQIMAMSSQLQVKSAEEARRFKTEREAWEQEKASLQRRIQDLEDGHQTTSTGAPQSAGSDASSTLDDALATMSVEALRQEVLKSRARCAELELILQDVSGETELLDRALSAMSSIKQRLAQSNTKRDDAS